MSKPLSAPKSEPSSTETVHSALRQAILAGELAPGSALSQVRLAEEFSVSRIPIREALRRLQQEGLVEGEHNYRMRVTALSLADLEALYTHRILLESFGVHCTVARLSEEDMQALGNTLEHMNALDVQGDLNGWAAGNARFHQQLVKYTNLHIQKDIQRYAEASVRYRRLRIESSAGARVALQREHRTILAACEERDARRASGLLAKHLARTALGIVAELRPEHDPVTLRTALRHVLASSSVLDGLDDI